jgi:hypothetical protein
VVVFGEGATTKVQVLRFGQDDGVGWLGLVKVVASGSMIMYQAFAVENWPQRKDAKERRKNGNLFLLQAKQ